MAVIKVAVLIPTCFEIECPTCKRIVPGMAGSLFWTVPELDLARAQDLKCLECGNPLRIPIPRLPKRR